MIAGGVDAGFNPITFAGLTACNALSKRNDDPQTASRPWNQSRDGFVMGEGAGVLSMIGHALGAAGGMEAIATTSFIPFRWSEVLRKTCLLQYTLFCLSTDTVFNDQHLWFGHLTTVAVAVAVASRWAEGCGGAGGFVVGEK
ncbi:hypothetical protein R6Q59_027426 [Mikania micrantha]